MSVFRPVPTLRPLHCALVLALGLALAACGSDEPAPAAPESGQAAAPAAAPTAEQAAAAAAQALAALSPEELRNRARQAESEQRLYTPGGNNAVEYYLVLRGKLEQPDPLVEQALMELMPYTLIAAEQAIERGDFGEAERLRVLLERTDPQAPALPRIRDLIAQGRVEAERRAAEEAQRLADEERREQERLAAEQRAAATAAAQPAAPQPVAPQPAASQPRPAAPQPAAPQPVATQPAASEPPPAAPQPARSSALVAVSTPQPAYPAEALRSGTAGAVEVEFTVNPDGSVGNVRVVSSTPRGTFDRAVISTVRRWRYQPIASAQTVRRNFTFNP